MSRNPASLTLVALLACALPAQADTTILSANGQPWEVRDSTTTGIETGAINDGGQDAFDGYGSIRIRVLDATSTILTSDQELSGFNLTHDGGRRWATSTPVTVSGVDVSRALLPRLTPITCAISTPLPTSAVPPGRCWWRGAEALAQTFLPLWRLPHLAI